MYVCVYWVFIYVSVDVYLYMCRCIHTGTCLWDTCLWGAYACVHVYMGGNVQMLFSVFPTWKGTCFPANMLLSLQNSNVEDASSTVSSKVGLCDLHGLVPSNRGFRLPSLWIITSSHLHNTWSLQPKSLWMWSKLSLWGFYYFHFIRSCFLWLWRLSPCLWLVKIKFQSLLTLWWFSDVVDQ